MAKYLVQAVVAGAQVIGRAFARALQQEIQASKAAAAARQQTQGADSSRHAATDSYLGMSLQEAKQILNITDLNPEEVQKKYDHLFQVNDKSKGGSFYLQSKVVRAHERIIQELQTEPEKKQKESSAS